MSKQAQAIDDARRLLGQDLMATIKAYRGWESTGVIPPDSVLAQARDILLAEHGASIMVLLQHLVGELAIAAVEGMYNASVLEALRAQGSNP